MTTKRTSVFGTRTAAAIAAAIVTAVIAGGVAAASVPNNSVSTAKIQNGAVTTAKLANNAVTSPKIANGTIVAADLAPGAARIRSASFSTASLGLAGNGANQIVGTVNITAPVDGQLLLTGSMRPDATVADVYGCAFLVDSVFLGSSSRQEDTFNDGAENGCATNDAITVTAGAHTVELQASGVAVGNDTDWVSIQVLFVPTP